jgi:hypothetical protein
MFDDEGRRLPDVNPVAVRSIRQIGFLYKKVKMPVNIKLSKKSLEEYVDTDRSLSGLLDRISPDYLDLFDKVSRVVVSQVCGRSINFYDELLPHHGPGGTAERVSGNRKYDPRHYQWYPQLDSVFRMEDTLYSSDEAYKESLESVHVGEVPAVRVITVPKTQTSERVIALEPVAIQATQQSIKDYLVRRIEANKLTGGHVNFTDQSINQRLALSSSVTRSLATLDLKSASDRVHKDLVWRMFSVNPEMRTAIFATRSPQADVGGCILQLEKYASMGSALCFPVESLFFYVILLVSALKRRDLPSTYDSIKRVTRNLYVYGDDIICPVDEVEDAVKTLHMFGCVVGLDKSYWLSPFRESCGVDAYMGVDVTPVYMRKFIPDVQLDKRRKPLIGPDAAAALISCTATANLFKIKGFHRTAEALKAEVEDVLGTLPIVSANASGLGWIWDTGVYTMKSRWNRSLHRMEVLTYVPSPIYKQDRVDGWHALTKCLLRATLRSNVGQEKPDPWRDPIERITTLAEAVDTQHLARSPRHGAVTLKRRWVTP